ncbi:MAG TPA: NFACT family protein, partial [Chloroflexota bacterium]|nr:NFACT family protein [Chloroflexota bacterium]
MLELLQFAGQRFGGQMLYSGERLEVPMSFDALAMHAVKDELESVLVGGQVEKVLALSPLEIGLRVWSHHRTHNILISADAQAARVHLITDTLRRLTDDITPFLLLMRKYVRDGRITAIEQPPLERVVTLVVENRLEDGETSVCRLIIEVMGRHSNVILVGSDGKVLDALKRIPQSLSRQRLILPHQPYNPPPAVEKLSPVSPVLAGQLMAAAGQQPPGTPLWRFLQETV